MTEAFQSAKILINCTNEQLIIGNIQVKLKNKHCSDKIRPGCLEFTREVSEITESDLPEQFTIDCKLI